jgi:predicted dehydrogenase
VIVDTLAGTRVERLGTRPSYTYQLQGFVTHVVDGCPLPIDAADAVQNMEYVDSAYRAAGMAPR